jgi:hypothetical protein
MAENPKSLAQLEELGRALKIKGAPTAEEIPQIVERVKQLRGERPAAGAPPTEAAPQTLRTVMEGEKAAPITGKQPWKMTSLEYLGPYKEPYTLGELEKAELRIERTGERKYTGAKAEYIPPAIKADALRGLNKQLAKVEEMRQERQAYIDDYNQRETQHRAAIEQALREGKPVPPEVLEDYPDLKTAAPPATSEAPQNLRTLMEGETAAGAPRELWQKTQAEAVGEPPVIPEAPRPLVKTYGPKWESRPDIAELKRKVSAATSARSKALKQYKQYVERSNAHLAAVKQALQQGKPVPPEVLADYPFLVEQ